MKNVVSSFILIIMALQLPAQKAERVLLEKVYEPNEKAFTILKPAGWIVQGGIVRWDPNSAGGAANAIEAKIDFALLKDNQVRWLSTGSDIYLDLTGSMVPRDVSRRDL
ncbi:MAG: hypothetical protein R2744_09080 [Bacteroidales bacterium]